MRVLPRQPIGNSCQIHQVLSGAGLAVGQTFRADAATIRTPLELLVKAPPLLLDSQVTDGLKQESCVTFSMPKSA